jgi:hypothetical protein
MDLRETGRKDVTWIQLAEESVQWWSIVTTVMNLEVPFKKKEFLDYLSSY